MSIIVREARPEEMNFVQDSWRRSIWKNEVDQNAILWDTFFYGFERYLQAVNQIPQVRCTVAELEDVPGEILGYAVHLDEENCLWLYVKAQYRRAGTGTLLLRHADTLGTLTRTGKAFAKALDIRIDPFMVFNQQSAKEAT